jgi:glycosyltransferase involved in cell wall biosynthesis
MGEPNPLISVIIPNYNYGQYLGEAIESVLNQTYKNIQLIVVDNESTDNSIEIASRYLDAITLIQKPHGGVSSARNLGITVAKGQYICFLDSDDTWTAEKLEMQLEIASKTQADLIYSGVMVCDAELSKVEELSPEYRGDCYSLFLKYPTRAIILLGCSNAMIRSEVINQTGMFKCYLHISADWDFFRRICKIAYVEYVPFAQVNYRRHNLNMSSRSVAKYYSDNELAVRDCIKEIQTERKKISLGLTRFLLWFRFQCQAIKALLKSKSYGEVAKRVIRIFDVFFN